VKWVWAAFFFAYLGVQALALWRLKGAQKRRSNMVLLFMTILIGVSDAIRGIFFFENRAAYRVGMLTVGIAAIFSTVVLVRMFAESPSDGPVSQNDAERYIQPLELN
jgi:hypothetical protein